MEKKLIASKLAELVSLVESEAESLNLKNKELIKENKGLKDCNFKLSDRLETKQKQLEKYKNLLNITPGTNDSKLELLELFTETVIPFISEKIESNHTSKIIDYINTEILNKNKKEEEEEKIWNNVLGTDLEFLYPYLREGYLNMNIKALKSYLNNMSSMAFLNWRKRILEPTIERAGNMSCPIFRDKLTGISNPITFNDSCLNNLLEYLADTKTDFIPFIQDYFEEISESPILKKELGLPQNTDGLNIYTYEKLKRNTIMRYLQSKKIL